MMTSHITEALSVEDLELITDRTSHALDYTEHLQALCRMVRQSGRATPVQGDMSTEDVSKIVAGMNLSLGMIQAALEDVQSVLPKGHGQADEDTIVLNGTETTALVEATSR